MAPLPQLIVSPLTVTSPGKRPCTEFVAQQVRVGLDRSEIVDGEDFDILAVRLDGGAQNVAADAAKSVDGNANRHFPGLLYAILL